MADFLVGVLSSALTLLLPRRKERLPVKRALTVSLLLRALDRTRVTAEKKRLCVEVWTHSFVCRKWRNDGPETWTACVACPSSRKAVRKK